MEKDQGDMLVIFIEQDTPRVRYTFSLLFDWVYQVGYRLTTDRPEWENHIGPRLHYTREAIGTSSLWLPCGDLLLAEGVGPLVVEVELFEGLPIFFQQSKPTALFPFDLPALIFYLAARYEEYLAFTPDVHGRFPAAESLASRSSFLRLPLINLWAERLINQLRGHYPSLKVTRPHFHFLPTFDIDMAWAFSHRPWWIKLGGMSKALATTSWPHIKRRGSVLLGRRSDPFFSFPLIRQLHPPGESSSPIFFFLLGDYGRYDKSIRHTHGAFRTLLSGLARDYEVGIHLSYRSNQRSTRIPVEINRLSAITGRPVVRNRQHFLKLHLPDTYRRLIEQGIQEDYSMGYADDIGFRASLATPFPWYDLLKEETTELIVYPFQVMDVTLKNYLKWTPEEAWAPVWEMVEHIQRVGGFFCTLWHNSSFGDLEGWKPWTPFYQRLIHEIVRKRE